MEWQAGFACGALLMPPTALRMTVKRFLEDNDVTIGRFAVKSKEAQSLITIVATAYAVSREAARVRLLQQGTLSEGDLPATLF
jgi:Zn-dependent peptidase ImmA (M78 family)